MNISTFNWIPYVLKTSTTGIVRCLNHWMKEHVLPCKTFSTTAMNLSQKGGRFGDKQSPVKRLKLSPESNQ